MKAKDMFRHQLRWALTAYAVGLIMLAVGVFFRWFSAGMAATLFLLSVALGAKATMRCPYCRKSVAADLIRLPLVWRSHVPDECPHCGADFDKKM